MRRHAKASSAGSTSGRGASLGPIRRALATRDVSHGSNGSSAPSHRRRRARFAIGLLAAALVLLAVAPNASAVFTRAKTVSFGADGTSGTSFGNPSQLAYNQENDKLYVLDKSGSKIHAFNAPGLTLFGAPFPLSVASAGGEPDIASDNTVAPSSTAANLYYESESTGTVYGFNSAGSALGAPFPIVPSSPKDLTGVGVDPSGYVWVGDWSAQKVRKYDPATGTEVGSVATSGMGVGRPAHLAFDSNGDMYVAFYFGPVYKFTAASGYNPATATQIDSATTAAIAVDRTAHRVYAVHSNRVSARGTDGTLLYEFADGILSESLTGATVDEGTDTVYVSDAGGSNDKVYAFGAAQNYGDATASPTGATNVTDSSATLNATVTDNNALPTNWRLEFSDNGGASWSTVSSGQTAGGQSDVAVSANVTGLTPNSPASTYRYRVVTNKGPGSTDSVSSFSSFGTLSVPPVTTNVGAVDVQDTSVRLAGTIDPKNSVSGYVFEYGTTPALGSSTPPLAIGGGTTPIVVSQLLTGLSKDTTYYFRLVATNAFGSTSSVQEVFHTRAEPLPNATDRAYEQVSPVDKNWGDATLSASNTSIFGVTFVGNDGEGVAFTSVNGFGENPAGQVLLNQNHYASRRSPDGWRTQPLAPPVCANDLDDPQHFFSWVNFAKTVSANVEAATIPQREASSCTQPPLDPTAMMPATNFYRADLLTQPAAYDLLIPEPDPYKPFVINQGHGSIEAGSDDYSHVVYISMGQQTPDAPAGAFYKLYEWDNGTLRLVSIEPTGEPFESGSFALPGNGDSAPLGINGGTPDIHNAVSADGERIVFTNAAGAIVDVYMREAATVTHYVSESECTAGCGASATKHARWADLEGDTVSFTTTQKLTNNDPTVASSGSSDLYVYRHSANPTSEANLTLISRDNEPADGTTGEVRGVMGMSDDGETVYFVADNQLVAGEPTGVGGENIYRWDWNGGNPTLEYLATAAEDAQKVAQGTPEQAHIERRVSRDGSTLMIETSKRVLPAADADADIDVYVWREKDGWICVSCQVPGDPSGGPSTTGSMGRTYMLGGEISLNETSSAVSEDGERVLFQTQDALVATDVNSPCAEEALGEFIIYPCTDVYEWHDGRLALITPGIASSDVSLLGISESGRDVVFYTRQRLVGWDKDELIDIYDARIGGGFPEPPVQPAECEGETCRGQGTVPPVNIGAGTAAFQGPNDPAPKFCPKGKVLKKGKCVRRRRSKRNKRARARHANFDRRAGK